LERAAWVALSAVSGLGPGRFRRLLEAYGSALSALAADPAELAANAGLPESCGPQLAAIASSLERIAGELLTLEEQGARPLIWADPEYPQRLLASASPPPVLWWIGKVEPNRSPSAAVVGSREASEEGVAWAWEAAQQLAAAGVVVVSGLAQGVDAAAHEAALEVSGPTVGVCGCGLVTALDQGRGGLAGRVAEAGALCSELSPAAPLLAQALFARDRIIAGLAEAVVVVEARAEGGAVHTAKCALREGRTVMAVRWPDSHAAGGNRQLLGEGALPLVAPGDALAVLRDRGHG